MAQWDPAKKEEGGKSLYGSMMRQFQLAGGKVKGVLWYQGESDANGEASKKYPQVFAHFIDAVRSDFGQPELPFYYVQIGRFVRAGDPRGWNTVQEAQRLLPERVPNTAVISVIDLELDDAIHVGTQGLKRAGQRLARIAERELFGQLGATTPTLDRVAQGPAQHAGRPVQGRQHGRLVETGCRPRADDEGGASDGARRPRHGGDDEPGPAVQRGRGIDGFGLKPDRHIAGFSIRKEDGTDIPLIFEACVGQARDTVVLKLAGRIPPKAALWYGYGYDPVLQPDRQHGHGRARLRPDPARRRRRDRDGGGDGPPARPRHPRPANNAAGRADRPSPSRP